MPKIERLHQNTPEWHRWRLKGVGSSDAPVIMGASAFKTPRMLWSIKTRRVQEGSDTPAARRGRNLEQLARRAYEARMGVQMEPVCLAHERLEWMRASLDGLSFDGSIVLEIKCPWSGRDQAAREGRVPVHYHAQLQHQLEVSGAKEAHYWSFNGERGTLVRVKPDPSYIERLIEAEREFWRRVVENRWPEQTGEELDLTGDPRWEEAAQRYRELKLKLDELASAEQLARKRLDELASARRTFGSGLELLRTMRKGAVDYTAIPELKGLDLERYRKPPVELIKISFRD